MVVVVGSDSTHQPPLRDGRVADERGQQPSALLDGHAALLPGDAARCTVCHARRQSCESAVNLVTKNKQVNFKNSVYNPLLRNTSLALKRMTREMS